MHICTNPKEYTGKEIKPLHDMCAWGHLSFLDYSRFQFKSPQTVIRIQLQSSVTIFTLKKIFYFKNIPGYVKFFCFLMNHFMNHLLGVASLKFWVMDYVLVTGRCKDNYCGCFKERLVHCWFFNFDWQMYHKPVNQRQFWHGNERHRAVNVVLKRKILVERGCNQENSITMNAQI